MSNYTYTVTFGAALQATFVADTIRHYGVQQPTQDEARLTLGEDALSILRDHDRELDGHYDGSEIWIGGTGYTVRRNTGRPAIGQEVKTRVPQEVVATLEQRAGTAGVDRSEIIRRTLEDGLTAELEASLLLAASHATTLLTVIRAVLSAGGWSNHATSVQRILSAWLLMTPGHGIFDEAGRTEAVNTLEQIHEELMAVYQAGDDAPRTVIDLVGAEIGALEVFEMPANLVPDEPRIGQAVHGVVTAALVSALGPESEAV